MNTKLRFKIIAILISLSLLGLIFSQVYWLRSLYQSYWETTERSIKEAMEVADYKELFSRVDALKSEGIDLGAMEFKINQGHDEKDDDEPVAEDDDKAVESVDNSLESYISLISKIGNLISESVHHYIDSIRPISFTDYYQILSHELNERHIDSDYFMRVIDGSASYEYQSTTHVDDWKNYVYFDRPVTGIADQYYRLYIKSPERMVLYQMAGILSSSLLLVLLVVIAFIYLLRVILKQKTVEELKTDFTNNITHELKTPIAVAYAANDALLSYDDTISEKQKKYLTIIREQLGYLTGMVEQILTLSVENRTSLKLHIIPVKVTPLIHSLLEQQTLKTKKKLYFTCDLAEDFTVMADQTHLYNILNNLIENAIKYSGKEPVEISISGGYDGQEAFISVQDNGIGIGENHQQYIFDKFFRVPQGNRHNVKGYGLGLYYIKDLMNRHKGKVNVKSQLGKGSVFTLYFRN